MAPRLSKLAEYISHREPRADSPATAALCEILRGKYGRALQAVLFYGSCLRNGNHFDGLLDLYLIVDDYRATGQSRILNLGNRLLPPNVYYLETAIGGKTVRCKYALLSFDDFSRGCRSWFHPYIWGRFVQPTATLFCRSESLHVSLNRARAAAVLKFTTATLPCLPENFTSEDLWSSGLNSSYASELRPEKPGQGQRLYRASQDYYDGLTELALPESRFGPYLNSAPGKGYQVRIPTGYRARARQAWKLRAIQGKILSLLRLAKAAFTFHGGLDYICWKIERHSGLTLAAPSGKRHNPVSFMRALGKAWRQRGFH